MGVTHPYQPFPKPECKTTPEGMQAKLLNRCAEAAQKVPVDVKIEPKLQWTKQDEWTLVSKCGVYKIRKRCTEGSGRRTDPQFLYEAFRIVKELWDFSLGTRSDAKAARALCEANRKEKL